VLREVYRSLDANNKQLPMMGARTLIDMLMVDKVGDRRLIGFRVSDLAAETGALYAMS
jgi:hypothetical protein